MLNHVFQVIFHRARGFLPFLPAELVAGAVPAALVFLTGHPLVAILVWGLVVSGLVGWRRTDGDRTDYVRAWWRRRRQPRGAYPAERDDGVPFRSEEDR